MHSARLRAPRIWGSLALPSTRLDRMVPNDTDPPDARSRFRTTLIRVLVVQAVAVVLLGLLQLVYNV